jgi:hypothetical protein
MQHKRRQAKSVVSVEMREEYDLDVSGVDSKSMHVREERRAAVQQYASVDHDGPVVAVE